MFCCCWRCWRWWRCCSWWGQLKRGAAMLQQLCMGHFLHNEQVMKLAVMLSCNSSSPENLHSSSMNQCPAWAHAQ